MKKTKEDLIKNINNLMNDLNRTELDLSEYIFPASLVGLRSLILKNGDRPRYCNIEKASLVKLKGIIDGILEKKYDDLKRIQDSITKLYAKEVATSEQRFFHHNINRSKSFEIEKGCWIRRGNPTTSKMWSGQNKLQLVICDEVQRLGTIPEYSENNWDYDRFGEVQEILKNSDQVFFTGDNFQKLNEKYDQSIGRISQEVKRQNQSLIRLKLPESVGVPAEIGILMQYLTNPHSVRIDEVVNA